MKVSVNTLRFINQHYQSAGDPAPGGVDDLVRKIGAQLGAVEEVIPFGKRFEGIIIARVVSCEDHPNADRLHVCKIDDGGKAENIERDEQGHVQVVCGAPNVREGLLVAWLPPGATVPESYDKDPFVLDARELRGVMSNGMLASAKELSIGESHDGILEITLDGDEHIEPGTAFVDAYHLRDDVIIDMENKMFTHRPDCFGYLGIAREIEGISGRLYKSPEWYHTDAAIPDVEAEPLTLEIRNELPELVPRFMAVTLRDVAVKPSPVWLQVDLARAGVRSINNIVDYTNFFMLETGQPLHAYDYDKVMAQDADAKQATIVVRHPRDDEKITLLNSKEIAPRAEAIIIATNDTLIGVGGVMGGADTEVDEHTKNIIIECANFDMYSIRRTAMTHGLFTDAVTRFNKGQSPLQNRAVLAKIVDEIRRFAGGKVASSVIDDNHVAAEAMARNSVHAPVHVERAFINTRLGFDLSADEMAALLRNVEFNVEIADDTLTVTAPFWRTDIEIPEDVVEEVGRLYGFDHLPLELPKRPLIPAVKNAMLGLQATIRTILSRYGANEALSYSFVHGDLLNKTGQDADRAYKLSNASSPDLQYFRMSLLPSLLEKIHPNVKAGYDNFALFELGKSHDTEHVDEEGLPIEQNRLAFVYTAIDKKTAEKTGAAYYEARRFLTLLGGELGLQLNFTPQPALDTPDAQAYDPERVAMVLTGDHALGSIGEFKSSVRKRLKLPVHTAGFEITVDVLQQAVQNTQSQKYATLPRFPRIEQDICLRVPAALAYSELFDFVWNHLDQHRPDSTFHTLGPVDIYQRQDDSEHKQITLRLSIASYDRTMTDDEVAKLLDAVAQAAHTELQAVRI